MALVLTDDQKMIRESADGFFKTEAPVAQHRKLRDTADATGFDRDTWAKMAEMGFAGVLVPEAHGGAGFGHVAAGLIMEAMGRNLTAAPMLSTGILATTALVVGGSADQQAKYLPLIAEGKRLFALAADEAARHTPALVEATATPSGNGFKLNGTKGFVLDGHVADTLIVAARTAGDAKDPDGITLFLVDAKATGVTTTRRSTAATPRASRSMMSRSMAPMCSEPSAEALPFSKKYSMPGAPVLPPRCSVSVSRALNVPLIISSSATSSG